MDLYVFEIRIAGIAFAIPNVMIFTIYICIYVHVHVLNAKMRTLLY